MLSEYQLKDHSDWKPRTGRAVQIEVFRRAEAGCFIGGGVGESGNRGASEDPRNSGQLLPADHSRATDG